MRLRIGVAVPDEGGRTAIVGTEVLEDRSRRRHLRVGLVERVESGSLEDSAAKVRELVEKTLKHRPCVVVDIGNAQGMALRDELRKTLPPEIHKPHRGRKRERPQLLAVILSAYIDGRLRFLPSIGVHRGALDRALILWGAKKSKGEELESEDEALVIALGLSAAFLGHGADAREAADATTDG